MRQVKTPVIPTGLALPCGKSREPLRMKNCTLTSRGKRSLSQGSDAGGIHVSARVPCLAMVSRLEAAMGARSARSLASVKASSSSSVSKTG